MQTLALVPTVPFHEFLLKVLKELQQGVNRELQYGTQVFTGPDDG